MIAIISSNQRERVALAALCESQNWPFLECDSLRRLGRVLFHVRPKVVLSRHKLNDGYSEDVVAMLDRAGLRESTRVVVLTGPDLTSAQEARQIALGADVVLRDPVRIDVVTAYLGRFQESSIRPADQKRKRLAHSFSFAGATINLVERTLQNAEKTVSVTPREIELVQLLFEMRGEVATYDVLYGEVLGRRFRGDTSNMRVLLGKLGCSFRSVGLDFRTWVEVIPKTGYRYQSPLSL